jgi:hypothetical protein
MRYLLAFLEFPNAPVKLIGFSPAFGSNSLKDSDGLSVIELSTCHSSQKRFNMQVGLDGLHAEANEKPLVNGETQPLYTPFEISLKLAVA